MLNEIIFFWIISLISGLSIQMNWISQATMLYEISPFVAITRMVLGPFMVWLVIKGINYLIKNLFDFLVSFIGLILLSPILLITSLISLLAQGAPVLFFHERLGKKHT